MTTPWNDCKVAYDIGADDELWADIESGKVKLPHGWSLVETDWAGARSVAIFRVDGRRPTTRDGEHVLELLKPYQ